MQAARGASLNASDPKTDRRSDKRRISRSIFWGLAIVFVLIDQGTKHLALTRLTEGETTPLVGDYFGLRLVFNPGAAFSMATSATELLTAFACIAAIVVMVLSFRLRSAFWAVGFGFLLAGIVGNLIDRLFRAPGFFEGHVVDMLAFPNFPVFNVADVCINIAAGVIIIQAVRGIGLNGLPHDDGTKHAEVEPSADVGADHHRATSAATAEQVLDSASDPAAEAARDAEPAPDLDPDPDSDSNPREESSGRAGEGT